MLAYKGAFVFLIWSFWWTETLDVYIVHIFPKIVCSP